MHRIPRVIRSLIEKQEIKELRPAQSKALDQGLLENKNLIVCTPTSSGKTLVAELAFLNHFLNKKGKAVYTAPLKALATEKFKEFKNKYPEIRVALSLGDPEKKEPFLDQADLIVCSNERLDSLIRQESQWINDISLLIIDEIHLLNDVSRGPTLEIVITLLKRLNNNLQILGLSATIGNPEDLAEWLKADVILDYWRPVELYKGIYLNNEIDFFNKKNNLKLEEISEDPVINLALATIKENKQALVFVNTRKSAESVAEKLSHRNKSEENTSIVAEKIEKALINPTEQCKKIASIVRKGIAFHHAGLVQRQKELIEESFKNKEIKIICCTPTLCLAEDTKIWSNSSEVEIKNINNSHKLFVLSNNKIISIKPQKVQKMENRRDLIQITSVCGYSIKLTPNHKVLIKRDKQKKIIEAHYIKEGDKIATIGKLNIKKTNIPKIKNFVLDNDIPIKNKKFNSELYYLIGAMLGDGYSGAETKDKKIIYKGGPSIVGKDKEVFLAVEKTCKKLKISSRRTIMKTGTPSLVLGKNKWFREFLCQCGVEKGERKYINTKLMYGDLKLISSLLRGLFDTDGHVEKSGNIGFSNTSKTLINQIGKILLRFGIISHTRLKKAGKIEINGKSYNTLPCLELNIFNKRDILKFHKFIGFSIKRKQDDLLNIINKINSNVNYAQCENCSYRIYRSTFHGRTKEQEKWGEIKLNVIKILGEKGELGSRVLTRLLGCLPRKRDTRLNHHYQLIQKRRIESRSKTEQFWSLNDIGKWIYDNIIKKEEEIEVFFNYRSCPLCKKNLKYVIKGGWKDADFDGDIYWDTIKKIKHIDKDEHKYVYDVILPNTPKNDHMFVANGFIVHNSFGMNLPAFRSIIRDVKRFGSLGMNYLPVLEIQQMFGRAGRPTYDEFGEAILIAKNEDEKEELYERYFKGKPENIYSKLAVEPVLRTYLLSLISINFLTNKEKIFKFFDETFWAFQFEDLERLHYIIESMLELLEGYKFITVDEEIKATKLGKRVSQLYIDPYTANFLIQNISKDKEYNDFSLIHLICNTIELKPLLTVKTREYEDIESEALQYKDYLLFDDPYEDDYLDSIKTALMFNSWLNESTEEFMLKKYNIPPGELKYKVDKAVWLLYSLQELARILNYTEKARSSKSLKIRMKHGIKEELLLLIQLKGIGRVKARKLFNNNIRTLAHLKIINLEVLKKLIGNKTAISIREQLGIKTTKLEDF